jgi:ARP2/3 complex 16 kDa subunit (p16-Arc)
MVLTMGNLGATPRHSRRDFTVDQTDRDDSYAHPDIFFCGRGGGSGYPHEVHVGFTLLFLGQSRPSKKRLTPFSYKGMTLGPPPGASKTVSPQSTGFSQIQSRVGASEGGSQAMSVMLSWHEKLVEIAGQGSIVRVMSDRRTV